MFSYHPTVYDQLSPGKYAAGYKTAEVSLARLARAMTSHVWSGIVWKDGYRNQENFLFSDYCVLDIDEGGYELSLAQALRQFCDMTHIIGTTRNHQKEKHGMTSDRYRVVFRWETRITSLRVYRWNMQLLRDKYPLDQKALDGARFFYPCTKILSVESDGEPMSVANNVPKEFEFYECSDYGKLCEIRSKKHLITGQLRAWVREFLKDGKTIGEGRNYTVFRAAISLFECGYAKADVLEMLTQAPFPREDFTGRELSETVDKALKRFIKDGGPYAERK